MHVQDQQINTNLSINLRVNLQHSAQVKLPVPYIHITHCHHKLPLCTVA